jgi:hypothetical protein
MDTTHEPQVLQPLLLPDTGARFMRQPEPRRVVRVASVTINDRVPLLDPRQDCYSDGATS